MVKKNKVYVLGMFPYPSGEGLHVGHVRIYTAVDVMARYFRMKGQEVLHPMGWDAFGLPAENAAIKFKKNPMDMVPVNEANFKRQMEDLSLDFDWERAFSTTDPKYYAITQWIFLQLYGKKDEQGRRLVYREEVAINWCPQCKTGLANEEVLPDGTHERCGTATGKKNLPQWVMRITSYADRLLEDLDVDLNIEGVKLDKNRKGLDWPRGILEMQRNWIGKKAGLEIDFSLSDGRKVPIWTKFWETVFGTTFLVVAPELVRKWMDEGMEVSSEVAKYVEQALGKTELARQEGANDKTGVLMEVKAKNPVNGEDVPVFVADYVLSNVGTGAVMGVPAHDERDFAFAKKYDLAIRQVVSYEDKDMDKKVAEGEVAHEGEGVLVNSGEFNEMGAWGEGKEKMAEWMIKERYARRETTYHLRDWVFSRQRYWGEPIPLVYCDNCGDENGVVVLKDEDLPLELPKLESYEPTDTGESPLSRVEEWVNTKCPECGGSAKRETDTMPNWAGSCWYFLAYPFWAAKMEGKEIKNLNDAKEEIKAWMPVDWYLGGAEHAVLHLLYARFWVKVLQDLGIVDFPEPFLRLRSVGMVLAEDGRKMSKSIGNVVNPDDMVEKFGADAVRLYEMFMGPWDQAIAWDTRSLVGQERFVKRIRKTFADEKRWGEESSVEMRVELAKLLKRIEKGIENQKFNTAIAGMMELINKWREEGMILSKGDGKKFLQILSPFSPQLAEELWERLGGEGKVSESEWPIMEEVEEVDVPVTIVVQVNGKVRANLVVSRQESVDRKLIEEMARTDETVRKWVREEPKKVVFLPGKLVNFVV